MQEKKRISVITVCYNGYEGLKHTIPSVVNQSYKELEYIIIDGGSSDASATLFKEYEEQIDLLISERDNGIYDAMNKGLKHATGEYVCFLNAGDTFFAKDTLSQVFAQLGEATPDVIYGETDLVDTERKFVRHRRLSAPETLTAESFLRGMLVCHQSFYARRAIAPLYDLRYRFSSDFDWCLQILKASKNTHNTHLILTNYLSEGVTTQNHTASLRERFTIMRRHFGLLRTLLVFLK